MKILHKIAFLLALLLASSPAQAASTSLTHNFNTMTSSTSPSVTYDGTHKIATTSELVYTCTGGASFGVHGGYIHIIMEGSGNKVTTDRAVSDLYEVQISYSAGKTLSASILGVYISFDGSSWTKIISGITYISGSVTATMPDRGDYYLMIKNEDGYDFYVSGITYYTEHCNCFMVVPE